MMKRLLYILLIAIVSLPMFAATELDSLFHKAVYDRNFELMSQYAEQGVNIDISHRGYDHLMHYYAAKDDIDGVKWCIAHHMDVNMPDSLGATPLMHATFDGHSTICKLLIDNGADTSIRSSYGMNAAEYAARNSFNALAAYLNNPTTEAPHDFYQYRREIAKALRFAEYNRAKELGVEAVNYAKKELAPGNRYNIYLLLDIASVFEQEEDFETQEILLDAACDTAAKYVPNSEVYFRAKIARAIVNLNAGDSIYADSLLYYHQYIDDFLGSETKWWAVIGVVNAAYNEGFIKEADAILYSALDYAVSLADDDYDLYSDYIISTLSYILNIASKIGDAKSLEEAEMMADNLRSFIAGRHDYIAAMARVYLGHYYGSIGRGGLAKIWYQRANEDLENTVGKNHKHYIQNLFNLGTNEMNDGQTDSALVYFRQAKEILERVDNIDSYTGAAVEQSIATCLMVQYMLNPNKDNFPTDAEAIFLDAWDKLNKYHVGPDMNIPILAENISLYYTFKGEYDKAGDFAYIAMSSQENIIGKNNQYYLRTLLSAILFEMSVKNYEKVDTLITNYISITENLINEQFLVMPEKSRKNLWENVYGVNMRQFIPSIIFQSIDYYPALSKALYDCALFTKGILLHTSGEIQSRLREMHDPEIDQYIEAINYSKKRLFEIEQAHPGEYPDEWGQLINDIEGMESVVLNLGKKYQDKLFLDKVTYEDIKAKLNTNQTAVEILSFESANLLELSDSIYYVATIVTPDSEIPQYVYLCEESELSSLLNESNKDNIYSYGRNGQQLAELIWGKLMPFIGEAKTIYFSPDGLLCQLAVEALPLSKDSVYGDAYDIVRCSSTKYILQRQKDERPTQVDLFGGIQYDMTPKEMSVQSNALAMRDAYRGEMPDSLTRGHYEELAGAKEEVYSIARLLNKADINGRLYTGSNACEEAFKALSGTRPNVLHIATHGFFWPEEEASRKDYFMASFMPGGQGISRYVSAMERAGLLFAGANVAMTGHRDELPSNVEDGVLSAQEISTMDLYGTDLVVLSACETGQGDIEGDGVYGLQRAFKLAGVQTIIMSLWKVNDAATQMLMTDFYTNWITNKMSKRKAFESAKQKVRAKYPEPSCWAGFIMLD